MAKKIRDFPVCCAVYIPLHVCLTKGDSLSILEDKISGYLTRGALLCGDLHATTDTQPDFIRPKGDKCGIPPFTPLQKQL